MLPKFPLSAQVHERCRFRAGSVYCVKPDCGNPAPPATAACRKEPAMTARPEVVALLTDFDVERTSSGQRFVHRDGRPFTPDDMRAHPPGSWLPPLSA
jgi:hypothetical protein